MQIAIDGPSGAGKSTIAKELSKKLNIDYLDTGAMYRTLALYFYNLGVYDFYNERFVLDHLNKIELDIKGGRFFLFSEDVSEKIRNEEISKLASKISSYKYVREFLVREQQEIARNKGSIVMDGRDVGTVILKNADVKIFLTADLDVRAKRRYEELLNKDNNVIFDNIKTDLETRDYNDSNRENSPLFKAEDAIVVDSSNKNIKEIVDDIIEIVNIKEK